MSSIIIRVASFLPLCDSLVHILRVIIAVHMRMPLCSIYFVRSYSIVRLVLVSYTTVARAIVNCLLGVVGG